MTVVNYEGRMMWGVRRHDVGDEPAIWVMEGNEQVAENHAREMVKYMTEVSERNGWDNAPELLRCRVLWEVVT